MIMEKKTQTIVRMRSLSSHGLYLSPGSLYFDYPKCAAGKSFFAFVLVQALMENKMHAYLCVHVGMSV